MVVKPCYPRAGSGQALSPQFTLTGARLVARPVPHRPAAGHPTVDGQVTGFRGGQPVPILARAVCPYPRQVVPAIK
jgi:hypothetical protein